MKIAANRPFRFESSWDAPSPRAPLTDAKNTTVDTLCQLTRQVAQLLKIIGESLLRMETLAPYCSHFLRVEKIRTICPLLLGQQRPCNCFQLLGAHRFQSLWAQASLNSIAAQPAASAAVKING